MKRIGSFIGVLLLWFGTFLYAHDQIEMDIAVKTTQGLPLQEAGLGKPFILTLSVRGAGTIEKIFVDTHNAFELRSQGTTKRVNSINGVSSHETIVQYAVHAKDIGTFLLGPATVTIDGHVYSSNDVTVKVVQDPIERVTLHEPRLELIVPKGSIVIGQTVPLTMRFYHLGVSQLSSIKPPKISGFSLGALEGPFKGTAEVDGVPYDFVEWRTEIVAKQVGSFIVQPAHAIYSMKAKDRMSLFQLLSDHFSIGMQEYETDSNSLELTVDPLPPFKGTVHAVGNFTYFQALVNQTNAKEGEGIVYTLEIGGDDSVKELSHPALVLPESVTSYESKSSIQAVKIPNPQEQRKTFEYILQAREHGNITIPEQTFTFYDPQERQYKHLATSPVTLIITEDKGAFQKNDTSSATIAESVKKDDSQVPSHMPLYAQGTAECPVDTGMPRTLFWTFLFLLLAGFAFQWGRFFWQAYCVRNHNYLRARAAFQKANKRLVQARRERNARDLYAVFIDLFADRRGVSSSEVNESAIIHYLTRAQIPQETVNQWREFCMQLQTFAFYDTSQVPPVDIFVQAEKWLMLMEKII